MSLFVTDFDGTLFRSDRTISQKDYEALKRLGRQGVVRVIATGRSLFSARKVISDDFPIDFLIFSSGSGVVNWKTQELIYEQNLSVTAVNDTIRVFREFNLDFMIHEAIPDNHKFQYHMSNFNNPDFLRRINIYKEFAQKFQSKEFPREACQLLAILPETDKSCYERLQIVLDQVKIIRATSPLDHKSIWLEIFPLHVNKGYTSEWLCQHLSDSSDSTVAIGNDFNDKDLLDWAAFPYVVSEAPLELKKVYNVTNSNNDNPIAEIINKHF